MPKCATFATASRHWLKILKIGAKTTPTIRQQTNSCTTMPNRQKPPWFPIGLGCNFLFPVCFPTFVRPEVIFGRFVDLPLDTLHEFNRNLIIGNVAHVF